MGLPVPATERANEIMDAAPLRPQHQSDYEAIEHTAGTLREQSRIWGAPGGYPWLRGGRESDRVVVQSEGDEVAARIEVGRKHAAQHRARDWWQGQDWPEAID